MRLPLPGFRVDLAGVLYSPPRLSQSGYDPDAGFHFALQSETGGRYQIETSTNLQHWQPLLLITNTTGSTVLTDANALHLPRQFYRARQEPAAP